jgi:putative glutamine amidotransferase
MNSTPIILCTAATIEHDGVFRRSINEAYEQAIEASGGILLMIASHLETKYLDEVLNIADGILMPGGTDVDPERYGQKNEGLTNKIDANRDTIEIALLGRAIERNIPTLAICRGMQILNVKQGGTLYQDVEKEMSAVVHHDNHNLPRPTLSHKVSLVEGSLLHSTTGASEIEVNSLHHQGINKLGKDLTVVATSPDGLVEACEIKSHPFLVGVQWHPEELYATPAWKNLFDTFIKQAGQLKTK